MTERDGSEAGPRGRSRRWTWADDDTTPDEAAAMADGFGELLAALPDDDLWRIATWTLEEYTNAEIGDTSRANVALATVALKRIRNALTTAGLTSANRAGRRGGLR